MSSSCTEWNPALTKWNPTLSEWNPAMHKGSRHVLTGGERQGLANNLQKVAEQSLRHAAFRSDLIRLPKLNLPAEKLEKPVVQPRDSSHRDQPTGNPG